MFKNLARPQNLWAHSEDISSRHAAKNAKDSAALFGNPIDGTGNSILVDLHRNVNDLPLNLVFSCCSNTIAVLGVFACWREKKFDPEKKQPKNVL